MKVRFPDATARAPLPDPVATGSVPDSAKVAPVSTLPAIKGERRASASQ
jgi:hypothetical protein